MTKAPSPTTSLTPEEKLQTLFQDQALRNAERRKNASTFSQFANSEANADAGRFAAINKANVVGATPKQPDYAAPNWANDPTGVEPPLGFDVNETPIVGEPHEIEASLRELDAAAAAPATASGHLPPEAIAVERKGGATPTETSGPFPPAPSQELVASPNPQPAETLQRSRHKSKEAQR